MTDFIYRLGMATARDADEGRAFLKAFGLGLKLERVKRVLTQDEFADLIGVNRTFEGQLERGPRVSHLRSVATRS